MAEIGSKDLKLHLASLLKGISGHIAKLAENDGEGFAKGYEVLKAIGVQNKCTVALDPKHAAKNRYRNVPGQAAFADTPMQPIIAAITPSQIAWSRGPNNHSNSPHVPQPLTIPESISRQ